MMINRHVALSALAALLIATPAAVRAQDSTKVPAPVVPAVGPPIQKIATASAVSVETFGGITGLRELKDGSILVNDGGRRRLLLMDTMLTTKYVVLDSLAEIANSYGLRQGAMLPYRGDSTLFLDQAALALLVIDPAGKIARVRSVWRVQDLQFLASPAQFGYPGYDAKGRIIYKIPAQLSQAMQMAAMYSSVPIYPTPPDSAFVVAADLETRKLDTLGVLRTPKREFRIRQMGGDYGWTVDQVTNPLPRTDEWAVMPDNSIAFVRGIDYRVEYLRPDGTVKESEKLPYEWQRLLDDDKRKFIDSVRTLQEKAAYTQFANSTISWVNMYNGKYPDHFKIPEGFVMQPGFPKDWYLPPGLKFPENYVYACAPGVTPPAGTSPMMPGMPPGMGGAPGAAGPAAGGTPSCLPAPIIMGGGNMAPPPPTIRPVVMVDAKDLPDYRPPFLTGAVRADEDGNLWIRYVQPKTIPGGPVFDIVSPEGELANRIQLPPGYTLIGFGKGKVVYLQMRDATGVHLARVRLK